MLKAVRNRGKMPEETKKWYRAIRLWWVLTYIGVESSSETKDGYVH